MNMFVKYLDKKGQIHSQRIDAPFIKCVENIKYQEMTRGLKLYVAESCNMKTNYVVNITKQVKGLVDRIKITIH